MDDQQAYLALDEMASHRLAAMKADHKRAIVDRLLADGGTISQEQVDAVHDAEWTDPEPGVLQGQVKARALAAVNYEREALTAAELARDRVREKISKYEALLTSVQDQLKAAESEVKVVQLRVADAESVYRVATGNEAPPSADATKAHAETAEISAAVGGGDDGVVQQ